jgi:hypothetical protein
MKKVLFIFLVMFSSQIMAQTFQLTPNGFVDSSNIEKKFIVKNFNGESQEQLFKKALMSIGKNFVSPKDVISKVEYSQITVNCILKNVTARHPFGMNLPFDMNFNIVFEFKDGRMKINAPTIINIYQQGPSDVNLYLNKKSRGFLTSEPYIFDNEGKISEKKHKKSIENATNSFIKRIIDDMNSATNNSNW